MWFILLAACVSDTKVDRVRESPDAFILAPEPGAAFRQGEGSISFIGQGYDTYDDPDALIATWVIDDREPAKVSLDAEGLGTLEVDGLEIGTHTAVFTVTDSDDESGTATVSFTVEGPLGAPEVHILSPEDGASYSLGAALTLQGEASDTTTPADDLVFSWSSDIDGALSGAISGDGQSILLLNEGLSGGVHQITLAATDGDGEVGTDTITVTITTDPVDAEAGDLVFSELMINPEVVDDELGEWIELYNTSGNTINISGYSLRDDDIDAWELEGEILVEPGDYVVLCASDDAAENGGVPCDGWFYREWSGSGFALANAPDEVVLSRPDGTEIDWLHYEDDWIVPAVALGVDPLYQESNANDDRSHWCLQTTVISTGGEPGTPGQANDNCSK